MWFLFAFALSIQDAFSELGANTTAHDLALGCLLAWFPVLILGSIVDRNPIAAEAIRKKLNTLVDHVSISLRDPANRKKYLELFRDELNYDELEELETKIDKVAKKAEYMDGFFVDFAGQARVRWHYGAAHAILCDIEDCYIQERGRNWMTNEREARAHLVVGTANDEGLIWFDFREFWQIISAVIIVGGSCGGAFILSYFTPTIGLGCRSGGYTIFFTVATGLLIFEMAVWMYFSSYEITPRWLTLFKSYLHEYSTFDRCAGYAKTIWKRLGQCFSKSCEAMGDWLIPCIASIALVSPWIDTEALIWPWIGMEALVWPWQDREARRVRVEDLLKKTRTKWRRTTPQERCGLVFFRPIELFNTIWLVSHPCVL